MIYTHHDNLTKPRKLLIESFHHLCEFSLNYCPYHQKTHCVSARPGGKDNTFRENLLIIYFTNYCGVAQTEEKSPVIGIKAFN